MKVEANRSGRKTSREWRDTPAPIGGTCDAARVLAHRIEDLRIRRIDVNGCAIPALELRPDRACAVVLDCAVVLGSTDFQLRICCSLRAVVELYIGNAAANLCEGRTAVRRAEETVVAAKVKQTRRDRVKRDLLTLVQITARDRDGCTAIRRSLEIRAQDIHDGRISRINTEPGIVDGGRRCEPQRKSRAV